MYLKLLGKKWSDFRNSVSGNIAILSGLLLPVVVSVAAAGTDLTNTYNLRKELQFIADSAAYSALNNADSGDPVTAAKKYVDEVVSSEKWRKEYPFGMVDKVVPEYDGKSSTLKVTIKARNKTPFFSIMRVASLSATVKAKALGECTVYKANYIGNSYLNDQDEYVLTEEITNQKGWVWVENPIDLNQRQDIKIRLYFGKQDELGADGMAFTIHNDKSKINAQGEIGESLGVAWHPTYSYRWDEAHIVAPALVVEFDTWRNAFDPKEPSKDHTAVFKIGNKDHKYDANNAYLDHRRPNQIGDLYLLPNIEDDQFHYARFIWDPSISKLLYYLDGTMIKDVKLDLPEFLGSTTAYMGFSASTGGRTNQHKACFFKTRVVS